MPSNDGTMQYNFPGLHDLVDGMSTYSGELHQIGEEAMQELANIHGFFDSDHGSVAYAQAQNMIIEGINEGRAVIARHGDAVDTSAQEFMNQDISAGQSFQV